MPPEELRQKLAQMEERLEELEPLKEAVDEIKATLLRFMFSRYIFDRDIEMQNAKNMTFSQDVGTKIGTNTSEKIGFWNVTPVNQPDTITDPSGQANDLDSEARTAIEAIIDRLQELGLIA